MTGEAVDVFISGAGPVGLLLALHLRQLGVSIFILDAADKASPDFPMYGRACQLNPRSCEIVDQLGLFDEFAQQGFISNDVFNYQNGKRTNHQEAKYYVESRDPKTFFGFFLNLRLKYIEDILRRRLAELGVIVRAPAKLVDFTLDENADHDYMVNATCVEDDDKYFQIRSKYIVGADGGRSIVRSIAKIPFEGEQKAQVDHWVRIDGIVKTNCPDARLGEGSFESTGHGHALWAPLDHGATRIGYCLTQEMFEKYGMQMSAEDAAYEASKAVAPFELEFTRVDWHTVYAIRQRIAARYQERERILLAGDAAHTHSSGSALGLNTGIQDLASLSWRLAGVLNRWYLPEVLANYSEERLAVAKKVIENDKIITKLVAGEKPDNLKHRTEHAYTLLDEVKAKNASFNRGIGVSYPPNKLNLVSESSPKICAMPGHRLQDVSIQKAGISSNRSRFFELVKNNGKFKVIVLTGRPASTQSSLKLLRSSVDQEAGRFQHALEFITIVPDHWRAFDEYLGVDKFGLGLWDPDGNAYTTYGVCPDEGALLVVRPDGILGFTAHLPDFGRVADYLDSIVLAREYKKQECVEPQKERGEFLIDDENNLRN